MSQHSSFDQNPTAIVMVRPHAFSTNPETAADNHFQVRGEDGDAVAALAEFDEMVRVLRSIGIEVMVFDEPRPETPDAVFPNNWFSTHHDGTFVTYPMYAPNRRAERRADVGEALAKDFRIGEQVDLTGHELRDRFLEGTGAIVFDHPARVAYMARSHRADERLLAVLCERLGYAPFPFAAVDASGAPIYHTNVMMAVGQHTVLLGDQTIENDTVRAEMLGALTRDDRAVVTLSASQIENFAGNALELSGSQGDVLVMSQRAYDSLTPDQVTVLSARVMVQPIPLGTIEKSGGSARCMMAGVHLPRRV